LELDSGESLCQFFPFDYVTELLAWLTFFHYRLTHLPLLLLGIASAAISVGAVVLASREVRRNSERGTRSRRDLVSSPRSRGLKELGRRREGRVQ
jgi:hypothetical protein